MTQEEKQLLLQDLCARLPYGVIVDYRENEFEIPHWKITNIYPETMDGWIGYNKIIGAGSESGSRPFNIGEVKPYLRPMSSMTEEEKEELYHYYCKEIADNFNTLNLTWELRCCISNSFGTDWLNAHHFDYRNLIGKNLALEAPEGMYK